MNRFKQIIPILIFGLPLLAFGYLAVKFSPPLNQAPLIRHRGDYGYEECVKQLKEGDIFQRAEVNVHLESYPESGLHCGFYSEPEWSTALGWSVLGGAILFLYLIGFYYLIQFQGKNVFLNTYLINHWWHRLALSFIGGVFLSSLIFFISHFKEPTYDRMGRWLWQTVRWMMVIPLSSVLSIGVYQAVLFIVFGKIPCDERDVKR